VSSLPLLRAFPCLSALLLIMAPGLPSSASAQSFRFPSSDAHAQYFYVTAYFDHGSLTDWSCGNDTYAGHRGNDFGMGSWTGMDEGRDIVAAAEGVVIDTHDGEFDQCTSGDCAGGGGFGNHVRIRHANGETSIYAHLKQWSVSVSIGDWVSCGQLLGQAGSSGYSTGPHLHFERRDTAAARAGSWLDQGSYQDLPGLQCDAPVADCAPISALSCGDRLYFRNDDPASQNLRAFYGCSDPADSGPYDLYRYTGPEVSWRFATNLDEEVSLRLTDMSADLDLYLLRGPSCDARVCETASTEGSNLDENISFDAESGTEYIVVVDGWREAVSYFTLSVECGGEWPEDPTPSPSPEPSPSSSSTPTEVADTTPTEVGSGCDCSAAHQTLPAPVLLLPLLLILRARRQIEPRQNPDRERATSQAAIR